MATYYRAHVQAALSGAAGKVVMPDAGEIVAKPSRLTMRRRSMRQAVRRTARRLIAQHGDVWFAEYKPGFRNFESNIARMAADLREMDSLAARYGRKLRYAINPQVICCDTQEEAEQLADEAERNAGPRDRMVNALGRRPCGHAGNLSPSACTAMRRSAWIAWSLASRRCWRAWRHSAPR